MRIIKDNINFEVKEPLSQWKDYNKSWEKHFFNYVNNLKYLNYNFFDIGAAIGKVSLYVSKKFNHVIALEPDIDIFKKLESNIKLNNIKNISIYNNFLSTKYKKNRFILGPIFSDVHFVQSQKRRNCINYGLTIKNLLNVYQKKKFFIKIDIEGYEFDLLNDYNFMSVIKKYKPHMYLAIHFGCNFKLKYTVSNIKFLRKFLNLSKSFEEYKRLYNLIKIYKYMKISGKKENKLFFLKPKNFRKDVEIFLYN